MPSSVALRNTRVAISLRLAASNFLIGRIVIVFSTRGQREESEWDEDEAWNK
jgi:hypothetical protein